MAESNRLTLCALGDVFLNHEDPKSAFEPLAGVLGEADVVFANCEGVYTASGGRGLLTASPDQAEGLRTGNVSVMACANNHVMDEGADRMRDTLETLRSLGIEPVGAGERLAEARQHVTVTRNGLRISFVAFVSTFPAGIEARNNRPGVNPLRFHNHYYTAEGDLEFNPEMAPEVMAIPYPGDLAALHTAIEEARSDSDVVIASFHWGEAVRPVIVRNYERETARIAIDAGADAVLCHHPHIVRGVDFHRGKPIFHGLGNGVFHIRGFAERIPKEVRELLERQADEYAPRPYDDYPLLPMHPESRISMVACLEFSKGGLDRVGLIPALIMPNGQTEPLDPSTEKGREIFDYLVRATSEAGLESTIEPDGDWKLAGVPVCAVVESGGGRS
jgi:poly-gamma-glutamate capsule biosynthesis protein CapA/YwtB (metallophosphatase superfamily)